MKIKLNDNYPIDNNDVFIPKNIISDNKISIEIRGIMISILADFYNVEMILDTDLFATEKKCNPKKVFKAAQELIKKTYIIEIKD